MAVGEIARTTRSTPSPRELVHPDPDAPRWLELHGTGGTARFMALTSDLSRAHDVAGNGKRICPGHAYAGLDSAVAWAALCRDPLCGAPRQSIESFAERWRAVRPAAPAEPCHYVSLGPGDGRKDGVVLDDLSRVNADLCYLPVDAAEELLHLAVRGLIRRLDLPTDRVLSLPWDFSSRESVTALRSLLDELFGSTPVLFSLLGNTIAQFDTDAAQLSLLAGELLRPADRLLLEVEATSSLDERLVAAAEHEQGPAFAEFVISALRRHTGVTATREDVEHLGGVEGDRALLVKTAYRNRADEDVVLALPNSTEVPFAPGDTIRLSLSRKYSPEGLAAMLASAGLTITADACTGTGGPFGLALLMLAPAA
jgi:uncharacterized SAM-dependent methyltransferase